MAQTNLKAITLITYNSNIVAPAFAPMNAGLTNACSMLFINNDTTQDIFISLDGINSHMFIASGSQFYLPIQMNNQPAANECLLAKGTVFWVAGQPGNGFVYISGFYV
jgi:hypothetical protein